MQFQTIMWRARHLQRLQADETADAVLDMDHEIAGRKAGDFRNEIVELAAGFARAHQTVAEDVLFADDGEFVGLEAGLHAEHGQHGLVARRCLHRAPGVDAGDMAELVVPQHARHAVARAFAPQRDHDLFALSLQSVDMRHHGLEHIDPAISPFRRKIAALPAPASTTSAVASGIANGVSRANAASPRYWLHSPSVSRAGRAAAACRSRRRRDVPSPPAGPRNSPRSA